MRPYESELDRADEAARDYWRHVREGDAFIGRVFEVAADHGVSVGALAAAVARMASRAPDGDGARE